MRRRRRARRYLALLAALALLVALFYRFRLTPLIKELAVTEVENQASDVISDAVGAQIADGWKRMQTGKSPPSRRIWPR